MGYWQKKEIYVERHSVKLGNSAIVWASILFEQLLRGCLSVFNHRIRSIRLSPYNK